MSTVDDEPLPISVVVPVRNGGATLEDCLASLVQLDYPRERLQILCVDNASTDRTAEIIRRFAPAVEGLFEAKRGAAAARNRGIRAARFAHIAFTDADCVVERLWLRGLVPQLRDPSVGIAGGQILARRPASFIERFGEAIHDHSCAIEDLHPPYAMTANWASPRDQLIAAGLFDERLLRGQDAELALRIGAAGLRLVYASEAIVYHRNKRTLRGLFHEGYVHGRHAPIVRALHADLLGRPTWSKQARGALRRIIRTRALAGPSSDPRRHLCAFVFNLGKAAGELLTLAIQ